MKKQDLEKKKKIKELIFKIIHSITYVLSALFIIVCIAVGVQSCHSKKNNTSQKKLLNNRLSDETLPVDELTYYYQSIYSGTMTYETNGLYNIASRLGYGESSQSYQSDVELNQYFDGGIYIRNASNNLSPLIRVRVILSSFSFGTQGWKYILNYVHYWTDNDMFNYFAVNDFSLVDGCSVTFQNQGDLIFSDSLVDESSMFYQGVLAPFYKTNGGVIGEFTFNNQINYNSPIGGTIEQPFINKTGGDYQYTYNFWFQSGGQLFNQIKLFYLDANAVHFLLSDNTKYLYSGLNSAVYFSMMYYVNTFTNNMVLVNSRNISPWQNGNALSSVVENSSTWTSQYYRYITILDFSDEVLISLSRFNNNTGTTSSIGYNNIGLGNVFTLLSSSFSAIFPLISIQIIPGLTIGLLLFLPLVVSIIILVFKAVKK